MDERLRAKSAASTGCFPRMRALLKHVANLLERSAKVCGMDDKAPWLICIQLKQRYPREPLGSTGATFCNVPIQRCVLRQQRSAGLSSNHVARAMHEGSAGCSGSLERSSHLAYLPLTVLQLERNLDRVGDHYLLCWLRKPLLADLTIGRTIRESLKASSSNAP